jgi:hypothetical protein
VNEWNTVRGLLLCRCRYGIFRQLPGRAPRVLWAGRTGRRALTRFADVRERWVKAGGRLFFIRELGAHARLPARCTGPGTRITLCRACTPRPRVPAADLGAH